MIKNLHNIGLSQIPNQKHPAKSITIGQNNKTNRDIWLTHIICQIPPSMRILDAGAGEQQYRHLCQHLTYVSQDFAQYDGKGDNSGLQTREWSQTDLDIISDISAIPEPDQSFDVIMCTEVFEHLPNPLLALNEFQRLLKPNGLLILTAPFCSLTHFAPYHYYSGFNRYFYDHWLPIHNFEILEIHPNGNYFEYIAQELRRIESIAIHYSNQNLSRFQKRIIVKTLKLLDQINKHQADSDDLLCFGYHVLARKK